MRITLVMAVSGPSLRMLMPAPLVQTSATPSNMLRKPSVTISGFMRKSVINMPWNMPMPAPAAKATAMATTDGIPLAICPPATLVPAIRMAANTPAKETMASTDRSMPPVRMTKVCPAATMPIAATSSASKPQVAGLRNGTDRIIRIIHSATRISSGPVLASTLRARPATSLVPCFF